MAPWMADRFDSARTEQELVQVLDEVMDRLGASSYSASRFASADHAPCVNALCRHPAGYQDCFEGKDFPFARDPVMQHLRTSSVPIAWNADTYRSKGEAAMFEPMGDFGVRSGVALALHLAHGRHFVVGFNWQDDAAPADPAVLTTLQACAVFAEPAFFRVWNGLETAQWDASSLTARELECLYWVGRGHTDGSIGALMGRSGRSVEKRLQSASRKLGTANRTEAAVLATRLGLLEPFHARYGRRYFKPTLFAID